MSAALLLFATYISISTPRVVLEHVEVIDGTGAAPIFDRNIVIENRRIAAITPGEDVPPTSGTTVLDLRGDAVMPGIVGMHDHLFYSGQGHAVQASFTAPRLYLGSGVTSIRTTGSRQPYGDINTKQAIDAGRVPGPRVHFTAPYITGGTAGSGGQMAEITTPEEARHFVNYWSSEGAEWIKAYTNIHRAELKAAIDEAHKRGMKVTGHLCSVTYQEAVALGIDNLEHGVAVASDFVKDKAPDRCPAGDASTDALLATPTDSPAAGGRR